MVRMAHVIPAGAVARRQRMQPDERRAQILDAARGQFSERSYPTVSTAEIAAAAGVGRSLVHHYFGGAREVFAAVVADGGAALADVRTAGSETPLDERLARNVAAGLDVVAANRETWLAVAGHGTALADPGIRELVLAAREHTVERMLSANRDVVRDTPVARALLRCYTTFSAEATRAWLAGEQTRASTEALLVTACRDLLLHTIPALERAAPAG
jgi:AcrR family transcriptional regulator